MKYGPKRKKNGRWDFTITDDSYKPPKIEPFGFCMEHHEKGHDDGHHDNPQASVECYLRFVFERGLKFDGTTITLLPCQVCGVRTMRAATCLGEPFLILCKDHCNEKSIKELFARNLSFEVVEESFEERSTPSSLILPGG